MNFVCGQAFKEIELKENGNITPCCPVWTNFYTFGNIFESNIEEIMNSIKAKEFRKSVINKTYQFCNTNRCIGAHSISKEELERFCESDGTLKKFPETFSFGHDRCCNVQCVFCRDHNWMNSDEDVNKLNSLIDSHFLPLLKDTKLIKMLTSGELFASRHARTLVKSITKNYPNIKYNIVSNGILFDKHNCTELGLNGKLNQVTISVHSSSKATYNKLVRNGDYDRLWKNIHWLNSLKKSGELNKLDLVFTINHLNYHEIVDFAKQASDLDIEFKYFEYRKEEGQFANLYDEAAVWLPNNKYHKKFIRLLKNPIFDSPLCHLSENMIELRNNSIKNVIPIIDFIIRRIKNVL